jgi:hypothetical protein
MLGMLCAVPAKSRADSFNQSINVSTGVVYNSNPLFMSASQPVWLAVLSPTYTVTNTSGLNEWTLNVGLNIQRSSDTFVMVNRNDPTATLGWVHTLQSGSVGVKAHYEQDSTLYGVGQTGNSLVALDGTSHVQSITANWLYNLNDTWQLDSNATANHTTYSSVNTTSPGGSNSTGSLFGYQSNTYDTKLTKQFSNTLSTYGQIRYTQFSLDNQPISDAQLSTVLGIQSTLSETLTLLADAGVTDTSGNAFSTPGNVGASSSTTGTIGSVALNYMGLRSNGSLTVSRTDMPSGFGGFVLTDELNGEYSHDLSNNNSIGTGYIYAKNLSLYIDTTSQFSVWFSHQISSALSLKLMLQQRTFSAPGYSSASDNVASLFLTYNNPDF